MKRLTVILAALVVAANVGAKAQDIITSPDRIGIVYDKVTDDGNRIIFADEYLVSLDDDLEVTAHFGVLVPQDAGLDYKKFLWTFTVRVRYDNPNYRPGKDLAHPFAEGDLVELSSATHSTDESVRYTMEFLNANRNRGDGWISANFEFEQDGLLAFMQQSDVTMLCFTQGGLDGGPVVCVTSSKLKASIVNSLLAILHRIRE